jgi:uncharacterized protein (UPF0212 family)
MISDEEIGTIIKEIKTETGAYFDAEVVQVICPACGESFKGIKREAGGFIAGHQAYHEFTNAQDVLVHTMGGV